MMDVPQAWQVHPETGRAESDVASVRYRRLANGEVQVYWVAPKVEMNESDAASVAAVVERIIRQGPSDMMPNALMPNALVPNGAGPDSAP